MKKLSLLIVDDDYNIVETLSLVLQREFHVVTASNGREGLLALKKNPLIALILLDLDMPVMNGLEMLKTVRKRNDDIKILIMSGKKDHEWTRQCIDFNVHGYLEKGFNASELISKIKKVLGIYDFSTLKALWGDDYETRMLSVGSKVRGAIKFIGRNFQKKITRDEIAESINVTPQYLSNLFHKECDILLNDYINRHRIQKSIECLKRDDNLKISEVASAVGIPSVNHFYKLFKALTGQTPQQYKKNAL